ncbi:hydrogenase expression/formation protein HypE [Candidatus Chrysopegis kryptomonas]|uniref:Hydrogenase expression/formation protein HypE n=1 Tax=Candidatus Chryseopegocella kryptomonas TaxID=1633643 RepID=A0A0P1MNC2_9BACT|nr:hydrogenase expression/formation protein HypE [Candidatus Chrysopegis kryptomonas]CUS97012.1 hydrogenase expression/formation protein HypE [Candidatus Chrysopegis kryptomonas]
MASEFNLNCPAPLSNYDKVLLGHGSGGKLTAELIKNIFLPAFQNPYLAELGDQAIVNVNGVKIAFTTDSYVVNPIFFPGGNIGELAVNGTVNDLAVGGARPLFISAGFILEEGFSLSELCAVVESMKKACERAGVILVTGDTKVVEKGKGDKIFINTSGIGVIEHDVEISPRKVKPGDKILINGPIGLHGIAILSRREGIEFEIEIESDTAPLNFLVQDILSVSKNIHWMRDPTRGGVSSSLNELAQSSNLGVEIWETEIPVPEPVKAACEMLGLDPLYVANEGKLIAVVAPEDAEKVLEAMRNNPLGREAKIIGEITEEHPGVVLMKTAIGGKRVVDMLAGEQLPRIC